MPSKPQPLHFIWLGNGKRKTLPLPIRLLSQQLQKDEGSADSICPVHSPQEAAKKIAPDSTVLAYCESEDLALELVQHLPQARLELFIVCDETPNLWQALEFAGYGPDLKICRFPWEELKLRSFVEALTFRRKVHTFFWQIPDKIDEESEQQDSSEKKYGVADVHSTASIRRLPTALLKHLDLDQRETESRQSPTEALRLSSANWRSLLANLSTNLLEDLAIALEFDRAYKEREKHPPPKLCSEDEFVQILNKRIPQTLSLAKEAWNHYHPQWIYEPVTRFAEIDSKREIEDISATPFVLAAKFACGMAEPRDFGELEHWTAINFLQAIQACRQSGAFESSLTVAKRAHQLFPEDSKIIKQTAFSYAIQNQYEEAVNLASQASFSTSELAHQRYLWHLNHPDKLSAPIATEIESIIADQNSWKQPWDALASIQKRLFANDVSGACVYLNHAIAEFPKSKSMLIAVFATRAIATGHPNALRKVSNHWDQSLSNTGNLNLDIATALLPAAAQDTQSIASAWNALSNRFQQLRTPSTANSNSYLLLSLILSLTGHLNESKTITHAIKNHAPLYKTFKECPLSELCPTSPTVSLSTENIPIL